MKCDQTGRRRSVDGVARSCYLKDEIYNITDRLTGSNLWELNDYKQTLIIFQLTLKVKVVGHAVSAHRSGGSQKFIPVDDFWIFGPPIACFTR